MNSQASFDLVMNDLLSIEQVATFEYLGAIEDRYELEGIKMKDKIQEDKKLTVLIPSGGQKYIHTYRHSRRISPLKAILRCRLNAVEMKYLRSPRT